MKATLKGPDPAAPEEGWRGHITGPCLNLEVPAMVPQLCVTAASAAQLPRGSGHDRVTLMPVMSTTKVSLMTATKEVPAKAVFAVAASARAGVQGCSSPKAHLNLLGPEFPAKAALVLAVSALTALDPLTVFLVTGVIPP